MRAGQPVSGGGGVRTAWPPTASTSEFTAASQKLAWSASDRPDPEVRRRRGTATLGVLAVALAVLAGVIIVNRTNAPTTTAASEALVRPDSHRRCLPRPQRDRPAARLHADGLLRHLQAALRRGLRGPVRPPRDLAPRRVRPADGQQAGQIGRASCRDRV